MPRWREGGRERERALLTDSSSLLLDFIGHDCLLVVLQLNAETEVAQLDAAFATQENIGSCNKNIKQVTLLYIIHKTVLIHTMGFSYLMVQIVLPLMSLWTTPISWRASTALSISLV